MLELKPVPDGTARGLRVRAPAITPWVLHLPSQRGDAGHLRRSGRRGWSCSQFQMERREDYESGLQPEAQSHLGSCSWCRSGRRGHLRRSGRRGWSCSQFLMEWRRDYESGLQPEAQAHLGLALAVAAGDAAISVDWMVDARAAASSRWNGAGITSPGPSLKRRHTLVLHLPSQQATRPSPSIGWSMLELQPVPDGTAQGLRVRAPA